MGITVIKKDGGGSGGGAVDSVNTQTGVVVLDMDDIGDGTTNKGFTSTLKNKLDNIEASADVTDTANVDSAGAVMNTDTTTASMDFVIDEDDMTSDSNTKVPTQQSVKAYVDANAGGGGGAWTVKSVTSDVTAGNTVDATVSDLTLSLDANSTYIIKGVSAVDNNNEAYGVVSKVKFSNAVGGYFIPNEAEGVGSNVVSQQSYSASLTSKTLIEAPTTTTSVARGSYSVGYTLLVNTGGSGASMTFTIALGFGGIGKSAYIRKGSFYEYHKVV